MMFRPAVWPQAIRPESFERRARTDHSRRARHPSVATKPFVPRGGLGYAPPLVNTAALRTLLIYAVILPLAIFVGWLVAGDMTKTSFATLSAIIFVLLLPLLI